MRHFTLKFIAFCALVAFGVFFGVEIAKQGIENINGPMDTQVYSYKAVQEPPPELPVEPETAVQSQREMHSPVEVQPAGAAGPAVVAGEREQKATGVSRLANKIGGLLQIIAHHGIEFVVSLIEKVIH